MSKTTLYVALWSIVSYYLLVLLLCVRYRNEGFDNGVFFNIEANTFDSLKIYFEAKRTCLY
jgi:hypothetical protein